MGNMDMMNDNINTFRDFIPVTDYEINTMSNVREIIRRVKQIPCTKCNYCAEVCPSNIPISELFHIYNDFTGARVCYDDTKEKLTVHKDKVENCIKCGECESNCPQGIKIREELGKIEKMINE
jgi:predicted aldo/keto reductase-like oxidoreductase